MIPVTLPILLMVFSFLILMGLSMLFFAGSSYVLEFARAVLRPVFRNAPKTTAAAARPDKISISPAETGVFSLIEGYVLGKTLRYHPGHTWVALQESGEAIIGIDGFAAKLIGDPKIILSPRTGQRFGQGERGWIFRRKGKDLNVPLPLEGEVVEVNERVIENPGLLTSDPYGGGWLAVLKPANLKENLVKLLDGEAARQWLEKSAAEVRATFSGKLGLVYQDGGMPADGVADFLDAAEWDELMARLSVVRPDQCGR